MVLAVKYMQLERFGCIIMLYVTGSTKTNLLPMTADLTFYSERSGVDLASS